MRYEEFKAEFLRLSRRDKQRFMREVGCEFCQEMMRESKTIEQMLPCCQEMMNHMPEPFRHWMQEWIETGSPGSKC